MILIGSAILLMGDVHQPALIASWNVPSDITTYTPEQQVENKWVKLQINAKSQENKHEQTWKLNEISHKPQEQMLFKIPSGVMLFPECNTNMPSINKSVKWVKLEAL